MLKLLAAVSSWLHRSSAGPHLHQVALLIADALPAGRAQIHAGLQSGIEN